jgi:hypothetical protein
LYAILDRLCLYAILAADQLGNPVRDGSNPSSKQAIYLRFGNVVSAGLINPPTMIPVASDFLAPPWWVYAAAENRKGAKGGCGVLRVRG